MGEANKKRYLFGLIVRSQILGCEITGDEESTYLTRYSLPRMGPLRVNLHVFHRSDFDEHHDHPWPFISVILWRGYIEHTDVGSKRKYPGMVLFRGAKHKHRVELIDNKKAATLMLMGKRVRDWGFFTSAGWVKWTSYFRTKGC